MESNIRVNNSVSLNQKKSKVLINKAGNNIYKENRVFSYLIYEDNVKKTSRSSRIVVLNIQGNEFTRISTNIKKMQFIENMMYFIVIN